MRRLGRRALLQDTTPNSLCVRMGTGSRYSKYGIEPSFDYIIVERKYSEGGWAGMCGAYVCGACVLVGLCELELAFDQLGVVGNRNVCMYIKCVALLTSREGVLEYTVHAIRHAALDARACASQSFG